MAFAVTARAQADNGTSSSATISSGTFTRTANSLVLGGFGGMQDSATAQDTNQNDPTLGGSAWGTQRSVLQGAAAPQAAAAFSGNGVGYQMNSSVYSALAGASPVTTPIVWDGTANAVACWYSIAFIDITGHDAAAPFLQTPTPVGFSSEGPGSLTMAALTGGSLVAVFIAGGQEGGGAFAAATLGNEVMTQHYNSSTNNAHSGWWTRTVDGTEDDTVVRCSDFGTTVASGTIHAFEIKADAGAAAASAPIPRSARFGHLLRR